MHPSLLHPLSSPAIHVHSCRSPSFTCTSSSARSGWKCSPPASVARCARLHSAVEHSSPAARINPLGAPDRSTPDVPLLCPPARRTVVFHTPRRAHSTRGEPAPNQTGPFDQ
eukprot:3106285-Prymnesium_polylepis.1